MATNVFDVAAKVCTLATNFLKFCSIGGDGVAFVVGVSGFECAVGVGKVYTKSIGARGKLCSWCSSTASFPLSSLLNKGRISSFFSHGQTVAQIYEDSDNPCY